MKGTAPESVDTRTISDFGEQWHLFTENDGYYASPAVLQDACGDLLDVSEFRDKVVCEIGAGAGRFVDILCKLGVRSILAVEPSESMAVLEKNAARYGSQVRYLKDLGERLDEEDAFDFVVSIGVLHHIEDPLPTVKAAARALRPGGRLLIWLYGMEGNRFYVGVVSALRFITKRIPNRLLLGFSKATLVLTKAYVACCKVLPLPMRGYFVNVFDHFSENKKLLAIFDQLNPAHAKYYRRQEVIDLLEAAGFTQCRLYHRHGYSWTALAEKPRS